MITICLDNVGKKIKDVWIYKEVSASFENGKIYGLIGRNGAGKTMLLRSICGLTPVSAGTITVQGKRIGIDVDIPESVGVIIEVPGFLNGRTGYANLEYLAGIRKKIGDREIVEALETVGLDPTSKKKVGKYSLGMRQRLGIAQAIMEDPDILLLDEPMNGLDVDGVEDIKNVLREMKNRNKTIILSSHHMEDIEELCDVVYRMEKGDLRQDELFDKREGV